MNITDKTRRAIASLGEENGFNNCNTEYSLIEEVKRLTFSGVEQDEAVRIVSRVYQVASEELS